MILRHLYKESYITGQYKSSTLAHIHEENRSRPFANSARLFGLILTKGYWRGKKSQSDKERRGKHKQIGTGSSWVCPGAQNSALLLASWVTLGILLNLSVPPLSHLIWACYLSVKDNKQDDRYETFGAPYGRKHSIKGSYNYIIHLNFFLQRHSKLWPFKAKHSKLSKTLWAVSVLNTSLPLQARRSWLFCPYMNNSGTIQLHL